MAIIFDEEREFLRLIPRIFDEHINLLDPCFATFNRLLSIEIRGGHFYNISADLSLISGGSFRLDLLKINKLNLRKMAKFYRDKEVNFMLKSLDINYWFYEDKFISDEDVDFINKLNPKMLKIPLNIYDPKNIKALSLLNCADIKVDFNKLKDYRYSSFLLANTPLQLFNFKTNQMNTFEWESIKFFIPTCKIAKMKIIKANIGNSLFIPLETIYHIKISRLKEISIEMDINRQFADLKIEPWFEASGFIVPIKYFSKIFIELEDFFTSNNNQLKDFGKLINEKQEKLKLKNLVSLFENFKLVPNVFSQINFNCFEIHLKNIDEYSKLEIMDYPNWISLKNSEIYSRFTLSHEEFDYWWNVLRFKRVRFNLTKIRLCFRLLSECLTVLSLCSDCPELKSIDFTYSKADTKNEHDKVEQAKKRV